MRQLAVLISIATCAAALTLASSANAAIKFAEGTFTADVSASTPTELAPSNGATLPYPTASIRLTWKAVAGATTYQVQVARQPNTDSSCSASTAFQSDNIVVTATISTNRWIPSLADTANGQGIWTGTYCWRVRAGGANPGNWSAANRFARTWTSTPDHLRFYNDHAGPIPRTSADADFSEGSETTKNTGYMSWSAVAGAASYEIQVGTSQSFSPSSVYATRTGIRDTRVLMLHLPDDTYYWRVRAIAPNGTEGGWSTGDNIAGHNQFTVLWYDADWSAPANLYPANGQTTTEMRVGWTPMPGASYYEYQIGTNSGCFWDPTNEAAAPDLFGDWTNYAPIFGTVGTPPPLVSTADPQPTQCRLSKIGATTMNNWVTLQDAWDSGVFANIGKDCLAEDGTVQCEPAGVPDISATDWGAVFHGAGEAAMGAYDGQYGDGYSIWWTVRPVYRLKPTTETGWKIAAETVVYGSWSDARSFDLNLTAVPNDSVGTRCFSVYGTGDACLKHLGSTMRADEAPGVAQAGTMQVPLLTWKPFAQAGGYVIQIARDPSFNNIAKTVYTPGLKASGYGFQQSYAMTEGLPDNSEGSGYWWRVIPCLSTIPAPGAALTNCNMLYTAGTGGLPLGQSPGPNYSDTAVAQTFAKRTEMQTKLTPNFEGATPLIQWTVEGVPVNDNVSWSRGVEGAEFYDFELSRDPFFSTDVVSLKTTMPRIVPFASGGTAGLTKELAEGIWYYRVRAVDRNNLEGSWSDPASFNKRITAPSTDVSGGGEAAEATVSWSPVAGAADYTVQWTTDSTFEGGTSESITRQTSYRIPVPGPGTYYWRVRANINGIAGQWSASQAVAVTAGVKLKFATSTALIEAKGKVTVYGLLSVSGKERNAATVLLQRKSTGCDASSGSYKKIASAISGRNTDDGVVAYKQTVQLNTCYRLAYVADGVSYFSAPISVKSKPVVSFRVTQTKVRRGKSFCGVIKTNTPVTGRMRVQYKVGTTWTTARAVNVTNLRTRRQCAAIFRAGTFATRVVFDGMNTSAGWKRFEDTVIAGPKIRVNDAFSIVRR